MSKTITKSFIFIAIIVVLLPTSTVFAKDRTEELEVIMSTINLKPFVTNKASLATPKLIEKPKPSRPASNPVKQIISGNSKDWSGSQYTKEQIQDKICAVFGNKCNEALIIAKMESGYRPWAISRTNDYGVFQLNCRWQKQRVGGDCRKFLNPDTNIRIAKQIYDEQGWKPWTTKIYLK